MYQRILLLSLCLFTFALQAQDCAEGETAVILHVLTDQYANETSWTLTGANGTVYLQNADLVNDSLYTDTVCVPAGMCLTFEINDTYGDGICCGFGEGYYELLLDGAPAAAGGDFGSFATHDINCPPGTNCNSALPVEADEVIADVTFNSVWYTFTTDESGMYTVSTCDEMNLCNTTLWVYDYCNGLQFDNSNIAAYAFNDDFCGNLAEVSMALGAGETYYIRVGSASEDCDGQEISWSIEYSGPISGCTDETACNFNPLATVDSGECYYPGDPECPAGPDLLMREDVFLSSLYIDYLDNSDGCLIEEACLSGYGMRELLRFDTHIDNIGESDYFIGVPEEGNEQFEYDACHNHWHYEGYANYLVFDAEGNSLPQGFKNGFCVLDLVCDWGTAQYGCGNMGISAGCGDIYGAGLECQWFDITDLPAGDYTFATVVNWDYDPDALGQYEMSYDNNWAQACIRLTRAEITGAASIEILADCEPYVDCAGTPFGNASPDCAGECNGSALTADIDGNGERNSDDVNMYLTESFADAAGTPCNDLNADGAVSVTDLILGMECAVHQNDPPTAGHNHNPCEFPFSIFNPQHVTLLGVGELNQDEGWFEVTIQNPFNKIAGFEFSIEGATITGLEQMLPDWNHDLHFQNNEIIGFSWNEEMLLKEQNLRTLARVYYSELTGDEICIGEITAVVNDAHEETATVATTCAAVISSVDAPLQNDYHAVAFPNPTSCDFTILYDYAAGQSVNISLTDMTGREVFRRDDYFRNRIELRDLPLTGGVYVYRVEGKKGVSVGKIVVE